MAKYQISVAREEADKVDTFRFAWQKLNTLAVSPDNILSSLTIMAVYTGPFPTFILEGGMWNGNGPVIRLHTTLALVYLCRINL